MSGLKAQDIKLPAPDKKGKVTLEEALDRRQSLRNYSSGSLTLGEASQLLWAAAGKNKWGKLTVPSAGALYPLTLYLAVGQVEGVSAGLYKYDSQNNSLALISAQADLGLALRKACLDQPWLEQAAAVIIIAGRYETTTSRYGERGRRYVEIEAGHAGQNIYLQATALDLGTVAIGAFVDSEVKEALGIEEEPLYLFPVGRVQ